MSAWMVTIAVDGTATAVEMPADPDAHLKTLQEVVGGLIERVSMFWYEEGGLLNLPSNPTASRLNGAHWLRGAAVIVRRDEEPLSEIRARQLEREITRVNAVQS